MAANKDNPFAGLDRALLRSTREIEKTPEVATATKVSVEAPDTEVSKIVKKEVSKFTSKLVDTPHDPPVNKVGYYFTRREMDRLDQAALTIKQIMRERYDIKVTKNEVVRACLSIGLDDWDGNELTSKLLNLLTSLETS